MKIKVDETWARCQAVELLKNYSIEHPGQIQIKDLAWTQGAIVHEGALDGAEAQLVFPPGSDKATIRVRSAIPEVGRKRFAVAHELGHWMLHRNRGQSQIHLFKTGDFDQSYNSSHLEQEANIFASELLMPEFMFRPRCEVDKPSFSLIRNLATEFRTTLTATILRYVELCPEQCAVVFSENGKVRWLRVSPDTDFWIEPGSDIHQDSYAFDSYQDRTSSENMRPVPANAWFSDSLKTASSSIMEASIPLGSYGTVMTFLWIQPFSEHYTSP